MIAIIYNPYIIIGYKIKVNNYYNFLNYIENDYAFCYYNSILNGGGIV